MSKTAAVFWLSVAAIRLLGHYYKTDEGTIEGLSLVDLYTEQGSPRLIDNIVLENPDFALPLWALKIMEDGHTSETTNLLETCSTDTEITEKTAVKAFSTKTSWELISMAPSAKKSPSVRLPAFQCTETEIRNCRTVSSG